MAIPSILRLSSYSFNTNFLLVNFSIKKKKKKTTKRGEHRPPIVVFNNVIAIFFHTTYPNIILKISFCTIDNLTI